MLHEVGEMPVGKMIDAPRPKALTANTQAANRRPAPLLNDIRALAYKKWVAAGQPSGDCTRFWLEAEKEFREGR